MTPFGFATVLVDREPMAKDSIANDMLKAACKHFDNKDGESANNVLGMYWQYISYPRSNTKK